MPADEEVEENPLDPAQHQGRPSDPTETTVVDPPVLDKTNNELTTDNAITALTLPCLTSLV